MLLRAATWGTLLCMVILLGCSEDGGEAEESIPITFASSNQEEQSATRGTTPLAQDFVAWGYKTTDAGVQKVFQGYHMTYVPGSAGTSADNTHCYSYVNGTGQSIKFWDLSASAYNFWGATGGTFSADGTSLTLTGLSQTVAEPDVTGQLFSSLYHRSPVVADVVQLQFKRPYARVRVLFYTGEALEAGQSIAVTDVTLRPVGAQQIITEGSIVVNFPKSGEGPETYATTPTAYSERLDFDDVTLDHTQGTATSNTVTAVPTGGTECYFVVPYHYNTAFTLSANIDDQPKTSAIPADLMNWTPNSTYTYIFKLTDGGKKIELYDVTITPWEYGGSQDDMWKNW